MAIRTTQGGIDFKATAEMVATMTDAQIVGALSDILKTLPNADAMDRVDDGDRGGYYRDEASIYHAEMRKRHPANYDKGLTGAGAVFRAANVMTCRWCGGTDGLHKRLDGDGGYCCSWESCEQKELEHESNAS